MVLDFIPPMWAGIMLIVGVLGLVFRNKLAVSIAKINPVFPAKTTLMIVGIVGIIAGGIGWITSTTSGLTDSLGTASITQVEAVPLHGTDITCIHTTRSLSSSEGNLNASFQDDPADRSHYSVSIKNDTGGTPEIYDDGINGTLTCSRPASHVGEDGAIGCWVVGEEFRSEISTTDSNTYNVLATSTTKSLIPGVNWATTSYLSDNAVATTASSQEKTILTFAEAEGEEVLGYYLTLAGGTDLERINEQTSLDMKIMCDEDNPVEVFTITFTKIEL